MRLSSLSMSTSMEIAFDHSFFIRLLLLGSQGGASSLEASPDSMDCWNQYTKLGPFYSASSFNHNFQPNDNQTFIVYAKSTLVLYRKSLWGFSGLGFDLEEKLCGRKCCEYYRPEGVWDNQYPHPRKGKKLTGMIH